MRTGPNELYSLCTDGALRVSTKLGNSEDCGVRQMTIRIHRLRAIDQTIRLDKLQTS